MATSAREKINSSIPTRLLHVLNSRFHVSNVEAVIVPKLRVQLNVLCYLDCAIVEKNGQSLLSPLRVSSDLTFSLANVSRRGRPAPSDSGCSGAPFVPLVANTEPLCALTNSR